MISVLCRRCYRQLWTISAYNYFAWKTACDCRIQCEQQVSTITVVDVKSNETDRPNDAICITDWTITETTSEYNYHSDCMNIHSVIFVANNSKMHTVHFGRNLSVAEWNCINQKQLNAYSTLDGWTTAKPTTAVRPLHLITVRRLSADIAGCRRCWLRIPDVVDGDDDNRPSESTPPTSNYFLIRQSFYTSDGHFIIHIIVSIGIQFASSPRAVNWGLHSFLPTASTYGQHIVWRHLQHREWRLLLQCRRLIRTFLLIRARTISIRKPPSWMALLREICELEMREPEFVMALHERRT